MVVVTCSDMLQHRGTTNPRVHMQCLPANSSLPVTNEPILEDSSADQRTVEKYAVYKDANGDVHYAIQSKFMCARPQLCALNELPGQGEVKYYLDTRSKCVNAAIFLLGRGSASDSILPGIWYVSHMEWLVCRKTKLTSSTTPKKVGEKFAPVAQAFISAYMAGSDLGAAKALRKHADANPILMRRYEKFFKALVRKEVVSIEALYDDTIKPRDVDG